MNDRRIQIIDAAIRLFHKDGFWNTSTAMIAQEAGIASGTLFNYFSTKSELIEQTYVHLKTKIVSALLDGFPEEAPVKEQAQALWDRYYQWHLNHPVEHFLLKQLRMSEFVSAETLAEQHRNFAFAAQVFERGIEDGSIQPLPLPFLIGFTESSLDAAITHAREAKACGFVRDEIRKMGFDVYWRAIAR